MLYLCIKVIKANIKIKFLLNLFLNFLLNSVLNPIIQNYANTHFIESNIAFGIKIIIISILINTISSYHAQAILEVQRREFKGDVNVYITSLINDKIKKLIWNELREQINKNDLNRKKEETKWFLSNFINQMVNTVIQFCTLFGCIFWIGYISPVSLIIYILLFISIQKYVVKAIANININNYHDINDRYDFLNNNLYTDIIHYNDKKTLDELNECSIKFEKERIKDTNSNVYNLICFIFNICFILNLLIISDNIKAIYIIIYIQYTYNLYGCINTCISLSRDYNNSKIQYDKLFNIINNINEKTNTHKINNFTNLYIRELKYTYPCKPNNIPFTLNLTEPIIFNTGEIIKLEGDYGNGKSTFCDIFNGIIPDEKYEVKLTINSNIYYSFDYLCKIRYYHEQFENIDYKPSVYEIISGNIEINIEEEKLVWDAMKITLCDNFITNIDEESSKKFIHSKNIGLSGGQKGSVAVARTMYRIIKNQPQIVTLDEIDKAIQANVVTKIMENIYNYCNKNKILLFVICHSTEVKEMKYYNKTLKFENGLVHLIN